MKYGFIGIGAHAAVISGHVFVFKRNSLQCSGGAGLSFTCSINHGNCHSAFKKLVHTKRRTDTHTHNIIHTPLHTDTAVGVKAKAIK